jgi:hypothetical protein
MFSHNPPVVYLKSLRDKTKKVRQNIRDTVTIKEIFANKQ